MQRFELGPGSRGRVGVLVHPSRDCAAQLKLIGAWAREQGLDVTALGTSAAPVPAPPACDLVIALGGDGTILRALQLAMAGDAAVLGVNFGHVGFLADINGDDLAAALGRIARGEAELDERTALAATLHTERPREVIAFNEVVVARLPGFGTARLRVEVGGERLLALKGDGIVIASPMGSTAYTIGAGGPAVSPALDAIVLTMLAVQGTPLRSLVVDGGNAVRVEMDPLSAPMSVEVDGRALHDLPASAALEVRAAPRKTRLVRTVPRTFYGDLASRL